MKHEGTFTRVRAVHPQWQSELLLEQDGDRVSLPIADSHGHYSLEGRRLVVRWDKFPADSFELLSGIYIHQKLISLTLARFFHGSVRWNGIEATGWKAKVPGTNLSVNLRVPGSDTAVFSQVFIGKEYASNDLPRDARTIVDLGANIGLASIYFALRYPSASIVAYEPDSSNFQVMTENVSPLRDQIHCVNAAAWSANDTVALEFEDSQGVDLKPWGIRTSESATGPRVPCFRLETIFDNAGFSSVDLLKIDIEGAEAEVFTDRSLLWLPRVRFICLETHDRFKPGSEEAVRAALRGRFEELPKSGENLLFRAV